MDHEASVFDALLSAANDFAEQARAPKTIEAYAQHWRQFEAFCAEHGLTPLPAQPRAVAAFVAARAKGGAKVASIELALTAISQAHATAGHPSPRKDPTVRKVLSGIKRALGTAQRRAAPIDVDTLRRLVIATDIRDRAILLVGFAAALRRGELAVLRVDDLKFTDAGLEIRVRHSKTDPHAAGATVGVPFGTDAATCPVRALRAWLEQADIESGAVFVALDQHGNIGGPLTGRDVGRIVKRACERAGLDPALYSGHSLRAGLATSAARAGKGEREIARQGRWKTRAMVDRYVRDARVLAKSNAAAGIGL